MADGLLSGLGDTMLGRGLLSATGVTQSRQAREDRARLLQQAEEDRQAKALQNKLAFLKEGIDPNRINDQEYIDTYLNKTQMPTSNTEWAYNIAEARKAGLSEDEVNKLIKDRLATQAKGFDTLQGQAYASAYGKGMGELPTARDISAAKERGTLETQLELKPQIAQAESQAKLRATDIDELGNMTSKLPELTKTIQKLGELGKKATYTSIGRGSDWLMREAGLPVGEGAKARTQYISMVNNQVLPLLRDTFGAAFTVQEGESLKATLGDPNKSPDEKQRVLEAFMNQKINDIKSKQRKTGDIKESINFDELWGE